VRRCTVHVDGQRVLSYLQRRSGARRERSNVGTNAAAANAVYHATGRRIRDLAIRIEDLL
jgi:hypothetical protein